MHSEFEATCGETITIYSPIEKVFQALFDIQKWPEYLPHVVNIESVYDDGQYQEFWMDVLSNGDTLKVRSVRNCHPHESIDFFQPEPPPFLQHHAGGWKFNSIRKNECQVFTYHKWNLNNKIAEKRFPATSESSTSTQIENMLRKHAQLALTTWKEVLER